MGSIHWLMKYLLFCEKHHIYVPNMEEAFILPGRSRRNAPVKTNRHHYRVEALYLCH